MINIPKKAKIKLTIERQLMVCIISYSDGDVIKLSGVESINTVLRNIYDKEGIKFRDLINSGRLTIDNGKIWDYYDLDENNYFVKMSEVKKTVTEAPVKPEKEEKIIESSVEPETKPETTVAETKEEADGSITPVVEEPGKTETKTEPEKKKGIKLRKVFKKAAAWGAILVLTGLGALGVSKDLGNIFSGKNSSGGTYNNENDEDGKSYTTTFTSNDDDLIQRSLSNQQNNNVYYNPYESLGSCLDEDIEIQLSTIDQEAVFEERPFQFENLVVSNDYDAIYALNSVRNKALNGSCSYYTYLDTLVRYMFKNDNYVNGSFIESYNSLNPYAQYIVVRMSQGALDRCRDYNANGYDFNKLVDNYNNYGCDLFVRLTQNEKTR